MLGLVAGVLQGTKSFPTDPEKGMRVKKALEPSGKK
jgi:hypothetical protein